MITPGQPTNPNIPSDAIPTFYSAPGGKSGTYWIWNVGRDWYWHALAEEGWTSNKEAASEAARFWIRYGQNIHPS